NRRLIAARTEGSRATLSVPRSSVVAAHLLHEPEAYPPSDQGGLRLLRQEPRDERLDLARPRIVGMHFADEPPAHPPLLIDDVVGGPVLVVEGFPIGEVVVEHHRMLEAEFLHLGDHVVPHLLVWKLGAVHTEYR